MAGVDSKTFVLGEYDLVSYLTEEEIDRLIEYMRMEEPPWYGNYRNKIESMRQVAVARAKEEIKSDFLAFINQLNNKGVSIEC